MAKSWAPITHIVRTRSLDQTDATKYYENITPSGIKVKIGSAWKSVTGLYTPVAAALSPYRVAFNMSVPSAQDNYNTDMFYEFATSPRPLFRWGIRFGPNLQYTWKTPINSFTDTGTSGHIESDDTMSGAYYETMITEPTEMRIRIFCSPLSYITRYYSPWLEITNLQGPMLIGMQSNTRTYTTPYYYIYTSFFSAGEVTSGAKGGTKAFSPASLTGHGVSSTSISHGANNTTTFVSQWYIPSTSADSSVSDKVYANIAGSGTSTADTFSSYVNGVGANDTAFKQYTNNGAGISTFTIPD